MTEPNPTIDLAKAKELAAKLRSFAIALDVGTTDKQIMVMGSWITAEELFEASSLIAAMGV